MEQLDFIILSKLAEDLSQGKLLMAFLVQSA